MTLVSIINNKQDYSLFSYAIVGIVEGVGVRGRSYGEVLGTRPIVNPLTRSNITLWTAAVDRRGCYPEYHIQNSKNKICDQIKRV